MKIQKSSLYYIHRKKTEIYKNDQLLKLHLGKIENQDKLNCRRFMKEIILFDLIYYYICSIDKVYKALTRTT